MAVAQTNLIRMATKEWLTFHHRNKYGNKSQKATLKAGPFLKLITAYCLILLESKMRFDNIKGFQRLLINLL
jgi:hypothetical protein